MNKIAILRAALAAFCFCASIFIAHAEVGEPLTRLNSAQSDGRNLGDGRGVSFCTNASRYFYENSIDNPTFEACWILYPQELKAEVQREVSE